MASSPNPFNLSDLNGLNGFFATGANESDFFGYSVSDAGDVNGDGFDDVIIGAPSFDSLAPFPGFSVVIFGTDEEFLPRFELPSLNAQNGFLIGGASDEDGFGTSVSGAGDVNGDGFDDVIIGAPFEDTNGNQSGVSYVVFGRAGGFTTTIMSSDLDGSNGFAINGVSENDFSGRSVSGAGDVNGDGFDDVIVGAPKRNSGSSAVNDNRSGSGDSYIVFGTDQGFDAAVELSSLNGDNGFAIKSVRPDDPDYAIQVVSQAGDVNGDGFDDVIISAPNVPQDTGSRRGESYVVFGTNAGFDATIDLSELDGNNGFAVGGITIVSTLGYSVSGAGDINGDRFDDLIITPFGAPFVSAASYVVFGTDTGFDARFDLASMDGSNGFTITKSSSIGASIASVSSAGDFNGDGFDDLLLGADGEDFSTIAGTAGTSYVIFGTDAGFSAGFRLSELNGRNGFVVNGESEGDFSGRVVSSAGDINGDGFDDLLIGAPLSEGNRGASYIVFGRETVPPVAPTVIRVAEGAIADGIIPEDILITGIAEANSTVSVVFSPLVNPLDSAATLYFSPTFTTTATAEGRWTLDGTRENFPGGFYELAAFATDAAGNTSDASERSEIIILDEDAPTFDIGVENGATNGAITERSSTTLTLTRNTITTPALTVTLESSDRTAATVPTTVTFAAGQRRVSFTATGVDDGILDPAQTATITATAAGFSNTRTATLTVTDVTANDATIFVDDRNLIQGNAYRAGQPYQGALFSNTDNSSLSNDLIAGTAGDDNIWAGTQGADVIVGNGGNDLIGIGTGDVDVLAGDGDDFIYSVEGGGGTNTLYLGNGKNNVWVQAGDYTIISGNSPETENIIGLGTGRDVVRGFGDNIIYQAATGANDGNKDIITGSGNDYIAVGSGDDLINAGAGSNILLGGSGADVFTVSAGGINFIEDFELGTDLIKLVDLSFDQLTFSGDIGSGRIRVDSVINTGEDSTVRFVFAVANVSIAELQNSANFV